MTAPSTIACDANYGSWAGTNMIQHDTSNVTYWRYYGSLGDSTNNGVKCHKTTFVWSDDGGGTPGDVITDGGFVYLGDGHNGTTPPASSDFTSARAKFQIPSALTGSGSGSGSGSGGSTFATNSTTYTPATGTQTHSYVADSIRNITIEKTNPYEFTVSFKHTDIHSYGQIIYYIRKNGDTTTQITDTIAAGDGQISFVVSSSTIYPNAAFDTGDVMTLHANESVYTPNPDGTFSLRSAGSILGTMTYQAVDVQSTLSTGRIGDTLDVSVFDRNIYPDYQNFVHFNYEPYKPASTYTGGSTVQLTADITGINSSGGPKLQQTNNYVINGTWVAGNDGVQQTNRKGILRVIRKTPIPVQQEILVRTFQVFGGESTMQGGQRNFW